MTPFCIPSTVVSWRRMSHRSSLCLHAVVFTQPGIRLNNGPLKTCRCFWRKVIELWCWFEELARPLPRKVWDSGRNVDECWNSLSLPSLICSSLSLVHSLSLSRKYLCTSHTHTDSIKAAIHVSDTSLSGARNAHKDLFISSLNARCHIRGSGAWAALAVREKRGEFM